MKPVRLGVFCVEGHWTLIDAEGRRLNYKSRELALAAAQVEAAVHRGARAPVELTIHDVGGRLRTMHNPMDDLIQAGRFGERQGDDEPSATT